MEVKKLFKQIPLPKRFILEIGINPTIVLMELIDKEIYHTNNWTLNKDWYFYHEKNQIFINTALPRTKFDSAKLILEEQWFIFTKLWEQKRIYFKINNQKLNSIFYPANQELLDTKLSMEPFVDEWYITYSPALAHNIWINETILLKDLISKRLFFIKKWELNNGYFYNSISNVEKDTTLTRKQQTLCIENLKAANLIDVKLGYNSNRYFCLNLEWIIKYEEVDLKDSQKQLGSKELQIRDSFINPFLNSESWKGAGVESRKSAWSESGKGADQKVEKDTLWKQEKTGLESWKGSTNNSEIIITNNNLKQQQTKMLLLNLNIIINNEADFFNKYDLDKIQEVCFYIKKNFESIDNPSWFLIKALKEWYNFNLKEKIKNEQINKRSSENFNLEIQEKEKRKIEDLKKQKVEIWKMNNSDLYLKIFNEEKEKLTNSPLLQKNDFLVEINTRVRIKKEILQLD